LKDNASFDPKGQFLVLRGVGAEREKRFGRGLSRPASCFGPVRMQHAGPAKRTVRDAGALQQNPVKMRLRAGFAGFFFPERWKFVAKNRNAWFVRAA